MAVNRLLLIDGSGFVFRAFHALPSLADPQGRPVGALVGFCNMILKVIQQHQPSYWAVIFDPPGPSFRHGIYPDYKSNRPAAHPDIVQQFPWIRQACEAFQIPHLSQDGFEADDVIASCARKAQNHGIQVLLLSSDKDMMQLMTSSVRLWDPLKDRAITEETVQEKFGVAPLQVPDVQALVGDASDHIPGVPGIGIKTAGQLIQQFGSLDQLYRQLSQVPSKRHQALLEQHEAQARLSYRLAQLDDQVPMDFSWDDLAYRPIDPEQAWPFLECHGLTQLQRRLAPLATPQETPAIGSMDQLRQVFTQATKAGFCAIYVDTGQKHPMDGAPVSLGFSHHPHQIHHLAMDQFSTAQIMEALAPLWVSEGVLKISHQMKWLMVWCLSQGLKLPKSYADTTVMAYLVHGPQKDEPIAGEDLLESYQRLNTALRQGGLGPLWEQVERPLIGALSQMEHNGILVDASYLDGLSLQFQEELQVLEKEIFQLAKGPFNIASPKQLGEVLFGRLGLEGGKKSKTGAYQTSATVLQGLRHPLADLVLKWRQNAKLLHTYTQALPKQINPKTQRIHTIFGMTTTSTGRLSSLEPNLQNIPVRTPQGQAIRRAFHSAPGYRLILLDYSQIELRLLAHLGPVPGLQRLLQEGQDIHLQTASEMFRVPLDQVTPAMRRQAKMINFGIIYGISPFGLADQLGISTKEAKDYIQLYQDRYPEIQQYMDRTLEQGRLQGWVPTLMGRRCWIPQLNHPHAYVRQGAERQAINAPIQGSAADIIKLALVQIAAQGLGRPLLQIHDELIFEAPEAQAQDCEQQLKSMMETAVTLTVPLPVKSRLSCRWD